MHRLLPGACADLVARLEDAQVRERFITTSASATCSDDLIVNNVGVSSRYQSPEHVDTNDVLGWTFAVKCCRLLSSAAGDAGAHRRRHTPSTVAPLGCEAMGQRNKKSQWYYNKPTGLGRPHALCSGQSRGLERHASRDARCRSLLVKVALH